MERQAGCDDFAGYKASFQQGITEIGCMAHAFRKFFELHATNKSQLAEQALHSIGGLYEIERQAREMIDEDRWRIRQEKAAPLIDALHTWMLALRDLVPGLGCRQSSGLQPQALGRTGSISRGRRCAHR